MLAGVVGLAPGTFHTMFVTQHGEVWSTGVIPNDQGSRFREVISHGATIAAAGNYFSIVVKKDGTVWVTGKNPKGQLNFFGGSPSSMRTFTVVRHLFGAKDIAAGGYHGVVLTQTGNVWVTGWNKYGQLGDGSNEDRTRFRSAGSAGTNAAAVAAGDSHSIVVKRDGSLWAAGRNEYGQLGDGSQTDRNNFVKAISNGAVGASAGGYHTMTIKEDGSVWGTGWNEYGQLGDGSATNRKIYVKVVSSGAKAVAGGSRHSMMLKQGGSVWTAGNNEYGQLGDGSTIDSAIFVPVISGGAKAVAAGGFHSMVLMQDGAVVATGSNNYGQFGDGSTTSRKRFVSVVPYFRGVGTIACTFIHLHDRTIALVLRATSYCRIAGRYLLPFVLLFTIW